MDCGRLKVTRGRLSAGFRGAGLCVVPRAALVACAPVAAAAAGASAGAVASPAGSLGWAGLRVRHPRPFFVLATSLAGSTRHASMRAMNGSLTTPAMLHMTGIIRTGRAVSMTTPHTNVPTSDPPPPRMAMVSLEDPNVGARWLC